MITTENTSTDTVLVVMDGSTRAHAIVHQVLRSGRNVVLTGPSSHDVVPFVDAAVRDRVWAVVSDPSDPDQVAAVIERATDIVGPVIMIVDPSGLLSDARSADRLVA
ncbi:hypothetical protein [Gordonia hankookensis]|uniref:Uncharacterized protein n=1 Tax=Gordonia hankookensis TaxID=589403 RepID=A0ABR7W6A9_9ACTN|nr:hypothetical protein [Gordonia hankookensis]MBD1318016.1 hypothetical protein [Gordonia hankookensis]